MDALNLHLFHWLAAGHTPDATLLWTAAMVAVGASWVCIALMVAAAWRHPSERIYFVALCLLAATSGTLAHAIAAAFDVPRPFMLGLSPSYLGHGHRGGLPSTHATVMFTVALGFLWRPRLRPAGWLLVAIALLTALARIHVGVHFPLDIVAGLLLAAGLVIPLAMLQLYGSKLAGNRSRDANAARMSAAR